MEALGSPREFALRLIKCAPFLLFVNVSLAFSRHISDADAQDKEGKKYIHDVTSYQIKMSCTFPSWVTCVVLSSRVSARHRLFSVHSLHIRSK